LKNILVTNRRAEPCTNVKAFMAFITLEPLMTKVTRFLIHRSVPS
jgi:hypothetical protein